MNRVRLVLQFLIGLAATLNLGKLDPDSIRKALVELLAKAQEAASKTPTCIDDLIVKAALALVQGPAWDWLLEYLRRKLPAYATDAPGVATATSGLAECSDEDVESRLAAFLADAGVSV